MEEVEKLKREFQLEEFRSLVKSVSDHVENQIKLERYTLLGIAAIYGWLFTVPRPKALPLPGDISAFAIYAFWLPPILISFAMLRSVSLLYNLEMIYAYIKEIEISLLGRAGWQAFIVEYRKQNPSARLFRVTLRLFWCALLTASLGLAYYFAPLRLS